MQFDPDYRIWITAKQEVQMGKFGMTAITIVALVILGLFIFRPI